MPSQQEGMGRKTVNGKDSINGIPNSERAVTDEGGVWLVEKKRNRQQYPEVSCVKS